MPKSRLRRIALVLAVAGALGLAATSMQAKRTKCVSTPVSGQPGTAIVTCTTIRP
jgi:ABC-type sugar transport system substrate-binding protein